jgi:RHS repeat-associated protein
VAGRGDVLVPLDALGSTIALTDESGKIRNRYGYDEYGNPLRSKSEEVFNRFTFTGQAWDAGVGLYNYKSRYYNPEVGRFLTQDSYRGNAWQPWTQNRYAYVGNNPVNAVDPTGHRATIYDDGPIGGVYELVDPETDVVVRTGRTNDLARRRAEHEDTYGDAYEFRVKYRTDNYDEQRGLEEKAYNDATEAGGGQLNKIKAISDRNPNAPRYRNAAEKYLEKDAAQEDGNTGTEPSAEPSAEPSGQAESTGSAGDVGPSSSGGPGNYDGGCDYCL